MAKAGASGISTLEELIDAIDKAPVGTLTAPTVLTIVEAIPVTQTVVIKNKHIKLVEKGLKEQYTPRMKQLTFSQGKLLIKLVNRECNQSSFQLVKAFMGPFKAGFYQTFAALFGASLKKEYHPEDEDKLTERVVTLVENGQL